MELVNPMGTGIGLVGQGTIELTAGQHIRIQTKTDADWVDVLNEKVPAKKTWSIGITVGINEKPVA